MNSNPFLDPDRQQDLYGHAGRLTRRSSALIRAKIAGRPVPDVVAELITAHRPGRRPGLVADLGCGRGTSSRTLADRLGPRVVLGIDASPALLEQARRRTGTASASDDTRLVFLRADFHRLPLPDNSCAAVVAAFCLYHSQHPEQVIGEIARVLSPDGIAVLVTKSLDSYRELDSLVADTGLDPAARDHESLYVTAHSDNLADLAATALTVIAVQHEEHHFLFDGLGHTAEYLATNPKYVLPPGLYGNPRALADMLRRRRPNAPIATRSTITYVVARASGEGA